MEFFFRFVFDNYLIIFSCFFWGGSFQVIFILFLSLLSFCRFFIFLCFCFFQLVPRSVCYNFLLISWIYFLFFCSVAHWFFFIYLFFVLHVCNRNQSALLGFQRVKNQEAPGRLAAQTPDQIHVDPVQIYRPTTTTTFIYSCGLTQQQQRLPGVN